MKSQFPICETCHQRIRPTAENLPRASRTALCWVGRNLYAIEGYPGLWVFSSNGPSDERIKATRGPGKSTGGYAYFSRAINAESVIRAALGQPTETKP